MNAEIEVEFRRPLLIVRGTPWVSLLGGDESLRTVSCRWGRNTVALSGDPSEIELGWSPMNWSDETTARRMTLPLPDNHRVVYTPRFLPYRKGRVRLVNRSQ